MAIPDLATLAMRLNTELRVLRAALKNNTLTNGVVRDALRGIEWVKQQLEGMKDGDSGQV